MITAAILSLYVALGGTTLGVVFTDQQWGDVQSTLNFAVLVYLSVAQRATRREALSAVGDAVTAVEQAPGKTADTLTTNGFQEEIAEALVDAMERRRRGRMSRATDG